MVLITNRQSNILQDIDSLHLFAQVVTSTCKTLDEREILRNAYELLSAFDELVTLGYRENLTISQIKTFLEMESHEERIQEIISRVRRLLDLEYRWLILPRTKNWKRRKNESARQSNWKCNARRFREVAEAPFPAHQYTQPTPLLREQPSRILTTHMKLRRTNLTSMLR